MNGRPTRRDGSGIALGNMTSCQRSRVLVEMCQRIEAEPPAPPRPPRLRGTARHFPCACPTPDDLPF